MPTTRARHMITETDEVAEALDAAAARWPHLSRGQLLQRLVVEGHRALRESGQSRVRAVLTTAGALTGAYGPDYLDELRTDWPE